MPEEELFFDYPKTKRKGDFYYSCKSCGRTDPDINGRINGHLQGCKWAKQKRKQIRLQKMKASYVCLNNNSIYNDINTLAQFLDISNQDAEITNMEIGIVKIINNQSIVKYLH